MTPEQEERMIKALEEIAKSLRYIREYGIYAFNKV